MIPTPFTYYRAKSVGEALKRLAASEGSAKLLAGGHSLIPAMKLRLNQPGELIDIGRIAALKRIRISKGQLVIGAGVTHGEIAASELVKSKLPILVDAAELIGDPQVRNKGTLGGSLAHADPSADWPAVLLATKAEVVVQSTEATRVIPAADFFTGFFSTAIFDMEMVTEVRIPLPARGTKGAYLKFAQPASRFALVGCAVMIRTSKKVVEDLQIAFTGVSENAFLDTAVSDALVGKVGDADNIAAAANKAAEGVSINSDLYASEAYRKHLAKVFAKRAIQAALKG